MGPLHECSIYRREAGAAHAVAMVVAALINQRYESGLRVPWIEDAAQILLAVGLAIVGREALVAGRESRATVSFGAAAIIAAAAAIRVVRRVRHGRRRDGAGVAR